MSSKVQGAILGSITEITVLVRHFVLQGFELPLTVDLTIAWSGVGKICSGIIHGAA
jgi:hypothetical protein